VASHLEELAYDLSRHALAHQEALLDELRARTGTLLAASSLVASFLGARAIDRDGITWVAILALTFFAASVFACVYVLLPKPGLIFAVRGTTLFEEEYGAGLNEAHRRLAYWLEDFADGNQPTLDRFFVLYRLAAAAVLVEVILWSVEIAI
jgi:hypothetical protein